MIYETAAPHTRRKGNTYERHPTFYFHNGNTWIYGYNFSNHIPHFIMNALTLDQIRKETEEIQQYTDIVCSENPEEIQERMRVLSAYLSRLAFLQKEAKKLLRSKKSSEIGETIIKIAKENYLAAKAQNALVDCIALEENELVDWLDRLNSTCVHQGDMLRSLLSYEKENLRIAKTGY